MVRPGAHQQSKCCRSLDEFGNRSAGITTKQISFSFTDLNVRVAAVIEKVATVIEKAATVIEKVATVIRSAATVIERAWMVTLSSSGFVSTHLG